MKFSLFSIHKNVFEKIIKKKRVEARTFRNRQGGGQGEGWEGRQGGLAVGKGGRLVREKVGRGRR